MRCSHAKELLSSYLDGRLDKESSIQLEEHLAGCDACRRQMDALAMLVNELRGLEPVKAPPDFLDQLHTRLDPRPRRRNLVKKLFHPLRIKIPLELASAAALALLIVAVIGIQKEEKPIFQKPQVAVTRSTLEAEADSNRLSRPLEKAGPMPTAKQHGGDRAETKIKPIVLAMILKSGPPDRLGDTRIFEDAASESARGKATGLAESKDRSLTHFPKQKRADQRPAEDEIRERASVESPSAAASLRQNEQEIKETRRLNLDETLSRVHTLIRSLGGNIFSEKETVQLQDVKQITVAIPADRYSEFIDELRRIAPFQTSPPPPPMTTDQDSIRIHIRFIVPK
ncbi:MAG: DUF2275 domain-containing protein [Deltaproteobacteria bacterium]|jgi:hypothetical protein|nr:DUF2275 domain-containing protein [Deltaproteobacteria bacterium]